MENQLISDYIKLLNQIFSKIKQTVDSHKVAILISGGIDSSIMAFFAKNYFNHCFLFSLGTKNSYDFNFVDILNKYLNLPLKKVIVDKKEIMEAKKIVIPILKKINLDNNLTQLSLAISFFLVLKEIKNEKINYVLTGQGPDVLLAGYHKYQKISLNQLNQQIKKDLYILDIDRKRDQAIADYFKIKLINPYLNEEFINLSIDTPAKLKRSKIGFEVYEKYLLRKVGETIGVPKEIVLRHKKALQYSTGIRKML